ncbi:hypothetical protein, partial [Cytobacillus horneckiae]|uniref:hypothetical protein n=1 Tax=Cytobacillus horneckiae TaxID=549687 RepID=UPI0019CF87EF
MNNKNNNCNSHFVIDFIKISIREAWSALLIALQTKKEHLYRYSLQFARQRPTLTRGQPLTTIGAEKLNFRV